LTGWKVGAETTRTLAKPIRGRISRFRGTITFHRDRKFLRSEHGVVRGPGERWQRPG
jgi:hypothetical protein